MLRDLLIKPLHQAPLTWRNRQLGKVNPPSCPVCSNGILILLQGKGGPYSGQQSAGSIWGGRQKAAPKGKIAPEAAGTPERQRDGDSKTSSSNTEQPPGETGRHRAGQLWAHLSNTFMHPGFALIPTAPGLDACLPVLVQSLLQGIQHRLWLSRDPLKEKRDGISSAAPPQVPTPQFHPPILPGAAGVSEAITGCTRSTAGDTADGAVRVLEACGRGFRSGDPEERWRWRCMASPSPETSQSQPKQLPPHCLHTDPQVRGAWHSGPQAVPSRGPLGLHQISTVGKEGMGIRLGTSLLKKLPPQTSLTHAQSICVTLSRFLPPSVKQGVAHRA